MLLAVILAGCGVGEETAPVAVQAFDSGAADTARESDEQAAQEQAAAAEAAARAEADRVAAAAAAHAEAERVAAQQAAAAPAAQPSKQAAAAAAPIAAFYETCSAVKAAGAAPIRAGEPCYSRQRDGDGVACET